MEQIKNRTAYHAFGLCFFSEIDLPELTQVQLTQHAADFDIVFGDLKNRWLESKKHRGYYGIHETGLLMYIPDIAIFGIDRGNRITVSPLNDTSSDMIRLYVLGTCIGVLLMQREILPLHGSAIVVGDYAYAFVGESGAGKSTLAAAFINRGYKLLSDDVIPVTFTDSGPAVTPAYAQQKLWQESLDGLGMEASLYRPLHDRQTKFAVPVSSAFHDRSVKLAGVFELMLTEEERVKVQEVQGLERFPLLMKHTFRSHLIPPMKLEQWHFAITARLIEHLEVYQLLRPVRSFTVNEIVDQVIPILQRS